MAVSNSPVGPRFLVRRIATRLAEARPFLEQGKVSIVRSLDAHGLHFVSVLLFATKRLALRMTRPATMLARYTAGMSRFLGASPSGSEAPDTPRGNTALLWSEEEQARQREILLGRDARALVSVVMPTWNRSSVLDSAITSVLNQSYSNLELLVADNGSTDDTREVVERYRRRDGRVRYFHVDHAGVSAARNVALEHSRGSYIAYLDSDNAWHEDYLLHMVHGLLDSGKLIGYCAQRIIHSDHEKGESIRFVPFDSVKLKRNNYIDLNVFMHKRDIYDRLGGFDTDLKRWVDWDLILRFTAFCEPFQLPLMLCDYRHDSSLGQITFSESATHKFKVLNKHLIDWRLLELEIPLRAKRHATIVIPVFNQAGLTDKCLQSIFAHTRHVPFDVVVVNNASTDSTGGMLHHLSEGEGRLSVVDNYENYGFALACHLGVARSRGEYVVLLNNDTEVTPGWLEHLIGSLEEDDQIGIVGPKLLFPDGTLQSGGMAFSSHSQIPYNIYQGFPSSHPAINRPRDFQAVTAACWALRAQDFVSLRGFDVSYLNGGEDIDFCFRLSEATGKRVRYCPSSVVYHYEGRTEGRNANILANRRRFVERWRHRVVVDDVAFFREDGVEVVEYQKKGTEPHGETAAYYPVYAGSSSSLVPRDSSRPGSRPTVDQAAVRALELPPIAPEITRQASRRVLRVGFSTIWHARGISFHTKQLTDSLEGRGFETYVFARWESDRFHNGGPIFHPRVTNGGDDPPPEVMLQWANDATLDLVVFMEVHPKDWKRVRRLKKAGYPVMCYENLDILRKEYLDRYSAFDAFLFNTFTARSAFMSLFPEARALTIPWGIVIHPSQDAYRPPDMRDIRMLHVAGWGGLNNRKNTGLLLEAFCEASLANATLRLYTQAPMVSYGDALARMVREHPRIRVVEGTIDDMYQAYRDVDLLLFPSKREGLGLPIVEALAHGVPVLTTDGYMMKQWAIPERHCLLCPAVPEDGKMFLPEMSVAKTDLVALLGRVTSAPTLLGDLKLGVFRDRNLWRWSWQPDTFAELLRSWIEDAQIPRIEDVSYLPEVIGEYESLRVRTEKTVSP